MNKVLRKEQILTIPNLLSLVRLLLIPVIVWLYCFQRIILQRYSLYNSRYKAEYLGAKKSSAAISGVGIRVIEKLRKPAMDALKKSKRFSAPMPIEEIGEMTKPFLSLGNQYGEGWFLTGEMVELLQSGTPNIICIQPFACLPNHVVGKGVIKTLKKAYPQANIAAVDYDPGASEVNQLNRIKLMLTAAKKNI